MTLTRILRMRLQNQLLAPHASTAADAVSARLGAVQAQDLLGAKWAIGLRMPGGADADIDRAVAERRIVRTWPMRGTLHFIAAQDVRWMLELMAPRVMAGTGARDRQLGLTEREYSRAGELFTDALGGGQALPRSELLELLEAEGLRTDGGRGYHYLWRLAHEGLLCFGPMQGKQPTFVLLDEWLPPSEPLPRDIALARIATRFFTGHGPATVRDLARWTGLSLTDARAGLASVAQDLVCLEFEGQEHWYAKEDSAIDDSPLVRLLPAFDEYVVGYGDRRMMLGEHHDRYHRSISANGMFHPVVVVDGAVAGTWKRKLTKREVIVSTGLFGRLGKAHRSLLEDEVERYGEHLGLPARLVKDPD